MSTEECREAKAALLERERQAFSRAHVAWIAIQNQLIPFGNGYPTPASIDEYYAAEADWKVVEAEVKRSA